MTKEITIYSTPSCKYCVLAKEYFKEKGIEYKEIDIKADLEARKYIVERSGQMGVPVITIDDTVIVGFNQEEIEKALDKKE